MARLHHKKNRPGRTVRDDIKNESSQATVAEPSGTTADAIMLPSRKAAMLRARDIVQEAPETRQDRVDRLSQAFQVGELILDSGILADKLIGTQLHDLQSAA